MTVLPGPRGLVWGFDITPDGARALDDASLDGSAPPGALRWLHLNLADQRARRWLAEPMELSEEVREAMLAPDGYQRALVDGPTVVCLFHDEEREFEAHEAVRMATLRVLATPGLIVTARTHPVRCADRIRRRLEAGQHPADAPDGLDFVLTAILEIAASTVLGLTERVQTAEDMLLDHNAAPDQRTLAAIRRRAVLVSRQIGGLRAVLQRLEEDEDLPEAYAAAVVRLSQRAASVSGDVAALQSNLRQLREELDLLQAQRSNQNLYVLSLLSALLLPATLVTGLFGMNVGGLPFSHDRAGGLLATLLAAASAFGVYLWLRGMGLFRR